MLPATIHCPYRDRDIYGSWLRFFFDLEFASKRTIAMDVHPLIHDAIGDEIIPSLLYVRLVAILDEAFISYINNEWQQPPKLTTLGARIDWLKSRSRLKSPTDVYAVKNMRNELAHTSSKRCAWSDLPSAIEIVNGELEHLHFVGPVPVREMSFERNPRPTPNPGAYVTHDYKFAIKIRGLTGLTYNGTDIGALEFTRNWSVDLQYEI